MRNIMSAIQSELYKTINKMSEDKMIKILSFAMYLQNEPEYDLEFSSEDENSILNALSNDERINAEVVEKRFFNQ